MKNIIIFEDFNTSNLKPFSINHASFELKCGIYSNLDRIINCVDDNVNYFLIVREDLKELIQERFPRYVVNPKNIPKGLYLNGAVLWDTRNINKVSKGYAFSSSGNLVAFNSNEKIEFEYINDLIEKTSGVTSDIEINYVSYLWDCIDFLEVYLEFDSTSFSKLNNLDTKFDKSIIFINNEKIYIQKSAIIKPGCILDASNGPIILNQDVIIESGTIIKGPIFIDKGAIINNGAKLKGNILVGPKCKIGGEVSNTIFHGYSNKAHDGFLGNSYIGEWVNMGANTNNSNLKNNYSRIKFRFIDKVIETNKIFLGAMIGDFTRTGISTMINTGSYIGLGANVFGGGFQNKYIESFAWGEDDVTDFNKLLETIKIIKSRRNEELSDAETSFLKSYYNSFIK